MAEGSLRGPTALAANNNKIAMSRALGAAFLNHQVEQLEKTVSRSSPQGGWRARETNRRQPPQVDKHVSVGHSLIRSPQPQKFDGRPIKGGDGDAPRRDYGEIGSGWRSNDEMKQEKDADIVVVDASVLVHALHQVKKWCREGRQEVVIVPLEALNTLDLLKKGNSLLAQRARSASRTLEAQVGTNSRIRVQRDDAFVLWDQIGFKEAPVEDGDKTSGISFNSASPAWVRRTISCARWEVDNAKLEEGVDKSLEKPKVLLAILAPSVAMQVSKSGGTSSELSSPVPLPAPNLYVHKHEPRSSGVLVSHWAARAGIEMLEVKPTPISTSPPGSSQHNIARASEDEDRSKRQSGGGRQRRTSQHVAPGTSPVAAGGLGLVERPPAVMQMMEMVAQPSKVVRVLARGEKLEPDP